MGICLEKIDELTDLIDYLIDHKLIIQEMAENMNTEAKTYSPNATLDLCEALIADYKKAAPQTNQGDNAEWCASIAKDWIMSVPAIQIDDPF